MQKTMRAAMFYADWDPSPDYENDPRDTKGKRTYWGSKVWRNPRMEIVEMDIPNDIGPTEVLLKIKACGICGSDVHMFQKKEDDRIFYPGLTAYPHVPGHEFSGIVCSAGREARKEFPEGTPVTCEEMIWCSRCRNCRGGWVNPCENLLELGFDVNGSHAEYIKVDYRYLWSIQSLREKYGNDLFKIGSLAEPSSVAYNAIVERASKGDGALRPGEDAVVFGGGPIGLASAAILQQMGASKVFVSEPAEGRRDLVQKVCSCARPIDPFKEDVAEVVLDETKGVGVKLYVEAAGAFGFSWPAIEKCMKLGRQVNCTVAVIGRVDEKVSVDLEIFQTKRAHIVGAQGHSGHDTFQNVISLFSSGMNVLPMITKTITLDELEENLVRLQTNKNDGKVTVLFD